MPVEPEVQDELEIILPTPPQVPLREGEEKFSATLNLEDARRKDAIIAELYEQLKRMQGTSAGEAMNRYAGGATAKRRRLVARKKYEELRKLTFKRGERWEGPCAPFTVINLNPVPLTLQGELQRWTIPAAGRGETVQLNFRGRKFTGSYLTISTPHLYPSHTGTHNDKQTGVDMPEVQYQHIPPAGLAHQFYDHFVEGAADAQYMGGIILFEGDIHTLDKKRMERNDGCIWVPKKEITLDGFGDVVYVVEQKRFEDCVLAAVTMQKNYADQQISEGHGYATSQSDIIRNQLSNYHRVWHNYALTLDYIEKALPWAVERLRDSPTTQVVLCPDCRTRQADPEQYFCTNCNAPFDPLKAFLAGKTVSPDRLSVYEGEEWDAVVTETQRRKAKIAILDMPEKKKTKAQLAAEAKAAQAAADEAAED